MTTGVAITNKVDNLIEGKQKRLGAKAKEGLVHSIFVLALTDPQFLKRAQELNNYLGDEGAENLEKRGL